MNTTQITEAVLSVRLNEVLKQISAIMRLKSAAPLTIDDVEDMSENAQYHIEWSRALKELRAEVKELSEALLELKSK